MGEYDESGTLLSRYTHGLGLIAKDDNFYTFDGNGNTSEITNTANEIINFYGYEPFGNNLFEGESVENDFEFVGQLGVREMGEDLIYMRNRFYSPALGRFMAEDPIGLAGGDVSFYRYVENDPVNMIDPWGLKSTGSILGDVAAGFRGAKNSIVDIAQNGPTEAKVLMATAVAIEAVPLAIAAANTGTAAAVVEGSYYLAPSAGAIKAAGDFFEGFLPGPPSTPLGVGGAFLKGFFDLTGGGPGHDIYDPDDC